MYEEKKVVVVIPSGRKRYMTHLIHCLMKQIDVIDEIRFWINTKNSDDIKWMEETEALCKKVKLDRSNMGTNECGSSTNIHRFFRNCTDTDTIYIRIDDDVVWFDEHFIQKICQFRLENKHYFLVFPNIHNNAFCDHFNQLFGMHRDLPALSKNCVDPFSWGDGSVAEKKHRSIIRDYLENRVPFPCIGNIETVDRVSINCISWLGEEFSKFDGKVDIEEEIWLASEKPNQIGKKNCILGDCSCIHYAFYPQRQHLDSTDILSLYGSINV